MRSNRQTDRQTDKGFGLALAAAMAGSLMVGAAQAQSVFYSTHDWRNQPSGATLDCWSDVKTPGDGRSYLVGTTIATETGPSFSPMFSNFDVVAPEEPTPLNPTGVPYIGNASRQVAVIQVNEGDQILWQRYFYGETGGQGSGNGLSTYARAIAVAPGATAADTRIAICGETYDARLPLKASGRTSPLDPAGFIAVYDGSGELLWTHHLFNSTVTAGEVASVTDLSIRRVGNDDVVTFCGTSTIDLAVLRPFAAPAVAGCSTIFADGGYVNNPTSQGKWHGFVGRLSAPAAAVPGTTQPTLVFQSIVGGDDEDGLFGLVELDENRFAVVGATRINSLYQPGTTRVFPLTRPYYVAPANCWSGGGIAVGVVAIFDATNVGPTQDLVLESATIIGHPTGSNDTVARDVTFQGGRLVVVGSTNDPLLADALVLGSGWQNSYPAGASMQGFAVTSGNLTNGFDRASYFDQNPESALIGVAGWSEYPDHVTVAGWTRASSTSPRHMQVSSLFFDTPGSDNPPGLLRLRTRIISNQNLGDEKPGPLETAFTSGFTPANGYATVEPCGGGLTVDSRGRVHVVGSTRLAADFEIVDGPMVNARGRQDPLSPNQLDPDGVHTILDMLPIGVCRSDGTGTCARDWARDPSADGGTTPPCALSVNGGGLDRMFIDCQGEIGAGQVFSILLDRPQTGMLAGAGLLQVGFPSPLPDPTFPLGTGVELWATYQSSTIQPAFLPAGSSHREQLWGPLPMGPLEFTVQFFGLFSQPVCGGTSITYTASPAILVGY